MCDRIVLGERKSCSPISRADRSEARSSEHGELGRGRRLEQLSAGCPVSCRPELSFHLVAERPHDPAVRELVEGLPGRAQHRLRLVEAAAAQTGTGEEHEEPGVVHRRHLVREEALGGNELVLCLDELPFGGQHRSQSGGRVRAEPATAAPDPAHGGLRRVGMASGRDELPALGGDEGERRAREDQARRATPDLRMLQDLRGGSRRLLQVAREEESARVRSASAREDLVGARPRELDGAAAVEHRPADAAVDRRPHEPISPRFRHMRRTVRVADSAPDRRAA